MSRLRFLPALALILFLTPFFTAAGQVQIEKSTKKVVVDGKEYYLHTVRKGQTAFSISKAYGITVKELQRVNPSVSSGTREGEVLKIAVAVSSGAQGQALPADVISKGIIYHYVALGETVYSLSRKYNVTEKDIVNSNPGININDISIGTRLAIPSSGAAKQAVSEKAQSASQGRQTNEQKTEDGKFIYHKVLKGETLSSLSREYNVSLRDLKRANKGLLFPKEGEHVMIPLQSSPEEVNPSGAIKEQVSDDSIKTTVSEVSEPKAENNIKQYTVLNDMKGSSKVAVLLPFFLEDENQLDYTDSANYDVPFIELYEGILIAADSLRKLGLKVELNVYDTGDDTLAVKRLISSGKLDNADLILGPVYSSSLEAVAAYASRLEIPVVSPVPLRDQNILKGKPSLFKMCPSYTVEQNVIANYAANIPNANVVFLYSDSLMYNPKTVSFRNKLTRVFWDKTDSAGFREFFFSGRMIKKTNIYKDAKALEAQLVSNKENVIIIATDDTPKVSAILSLLNGLNRKYDIRVTGVSEMRGYETIDLKYFYNLRMMFPSESYIDYSRPEVNDFMRSYYNKFKTEPNDENFAWRGFDMAYYFIGATASYGKSFYKNHDSFNPRLTSYDFRFSHAQEKDGFENQNMFIIQYNPDWTITVTSFRDMIKR